MKTNHVKIRPTIIAWLILIISGPLYSQPGNDGEDSQNNWPGFRGSDASGIAEGHPLPTQWSVPDSKGIKWKVSIPGLGHSSPVIWGNRIYITTAISGMEDPMLKVGLYGNIDPVDDESVHEWQLICFDKTTGEVLWQRNAHTAKPRIKRHTKSTHANSTPATDGRFVVTFFGSEGLFCFDMDGSLVWKIDLGPLDSGYYVAPRAQWGFASSPVIAGDTVFVQCDIQKGSFVAAFDIKNGKEIWRNSRDDVPTWGTPTVHNGQLLVNGYKHIGGYDLETGKSIWKLRGGGDIPVPTPIVAHDLVFITNAHGRMAPLYAIRLGAVGDISLREGESSNKYVAWSTRSNGAYMQTPLIYGDYIYSGRDNGVIKCYNAKTGDRINEKRLGSGRTGFTASPVAGDDKIYFTSEFGDVFVIQANPEMELLAQNALDEICMASPAISEGSLYFRTRDHLVAVGKEPQ